MMTIKQAGVVAVRDIGQGQQFGLVQANSAQAEWVLPKGHVEDGETLQGAALREAAEELGVTGVLLDSVRFTQVFTIDTPEGASVREVTYFPMIVTATVPTSEGRTVAWHTTAKARDSVAYQEMREMILRTRRVL